MYTYVQTVLQVQMFHVEHYGDLCRDTGRTMHQTALQLTLSSVRKRMRSGDRPGLQNRRVAGYSVTGGFDSHSLPPLLFNCLRPFGALAESLGRELNRVTVIKT